MIIVKMVPNTSFRQQPMGGHVSTQQMSLMMSLLVLTVINDDSDGDSRDGVYFVPNECLIFIDEDWRAHKWVQMILIMVVVCVIDMANVFHFTLAMNDGCAASC